MNGAHPPHFKTTTIHSLDMYMKSTRRNGDEATWLGLSLCSPLCNRTAASTYKIEIQNKRDRERKGERKWRKWRKTDHQLAATLQKSFAALLCAHLFHFHTLFERERDPNAVND